MAFASCTEVGVAVPTLCTRPMGSLPSWIFMSKCQALPFFVLAISGSHLSFLFFIDDVAWIIVASIIMPSLTISSRSDR